MHALLDSVPLLIVYALLENYSEVLNIPIRVAPIKTTVACYNLSIPPPQKGGEVNGSVCLLRNKLGTHTFQVGSIDLGNHCHVHTPKAV